MEQRGASHTIQKALKRALDVLLSAGGLLFLAPLMGILALVVRLESRGPVIYRHKRVGRDGALFDLYKFRSMVSGGDDSSYMTYLQQLIESEKHSNGKGMPYKKMDGDRRVTRVGRILRNYYLDELPQLWNILVGDMSLVGPRPHVQFEVDHYTPEQRRRLSVQPGATGLWQVAGKADCTFSELIALDLAYIDNWNFWLDLKIIFRTVVLMLHGGEGSWARMIKKIPGRNNLDWIRNNTQPRKSERLTVDGRSEDKRNEIKT